MTGCGGTSDGTGAATGPMILATTTSTQDSGLLDAILPDFEKHSSCVPKTVAVGSGEALQLGAKGDADVLLVHSPETEEEYMAAGHGVSRKAVMHNDFVLVGPPEDPAGAKGARDGAQALRRIARHRSLFASRADDSGTNAKELALWKEAGITPSGSWYLETGQGMGMTLTIASQKGGYTLADRGTFLATSNLSSNVIYQGSADLRNRYHVIVVKSDHKANVACAQEFSGWLRSVQVQRKIADFGVKEYGQPLFFPDAP
jgi:tungstate transport system substrate-binding protein